jgi:hypothetical protein
MFEVTQIWIEMQRALLRRFPIMPLLVLGALATGAAPASATGKPEIEGRWSEGDRKQPLVLDVSRCGRSYCGRRVEAGDRCGQTVLVVVPRAYRGYRPSGASPPTFDGQIVMRNPPRGNPVTVFILAGKKEIIMQIIGEPGWDLLRRTPPRFKASLARIGDAHCGPSPTS